MNRLKRRVAVALALVALWPSGAAAQEVCPTRFGDHTPCEITAFVPAGGSTTATLRLRFINVTGSTWNWFIAPANHASCSTLVPGHWASFEPFLGSVPPNATITYDVTVTMDAAALARGVHTAYGCIVLNDPDPRVPVPIHLAVDDTIFLDGFEA